MVLRVYMTRTERYKRSIRLVNELQCMKERHEWSQSQYAKACQLLDEPIAMDLHETGKYLRSLHTDASNCIPFSAFAPVFLAQASPVLLAKYGDLITNRGILG